MDSALFLRSISAALKPVVLAAGGKIDVASDPDEVLEMLGAGAPKGWRLILNWAGEDALEPDEAPGIVHYNLAATVQCSRGLTFAPGAFAYLKNFSNREPLLTLASVTSRWIRGLSGSHPDLYEDGFRFTSSAFLVIENLQCRQIVINHRCKMALDDAIEVPCAF